MLVVVFSLKYLPAAPRRSVLCAAVGVVERWGTVLPDWSMEFSLGPPHSTISFVMFTCCCLLWVPLAMSLPTSRWAAQKRGCYSSALMKCYPAHSRIGTRSPWKPPLSALRVQLLSVSDGHFICVKPLLWWTMCFVCLKYWMDDSVSVQK